MLLIIVHDCSYIALLIIMCVTRFTSCLLPSRFEGKLNSLVEHLHEVLTKIQSRIRAESFKVPFLHFCSRKCYRGILVVPTIVPIHYDHLECKITL